MSVFALLKVKSDYIMWQLRVVVVFGCIVMEAGGCVAKV